MAYELPLFGIAMDISYKTDERLYSDLLVIKTLNNFFTETLRRKAIGKCDTMDQATGYHITVTKHYKSLKEKNVESVKKWQFTYSFVLMDLITRMYISYAVSMRSEKKDYWKTLDMISKLRMDLERIKLDRY